MVRLYRDVELDGFGLALRLYCCQDLIDDVADVRNKLLHLFCLPWCTFSITLLQ